MRLRPADHHSSILISGVALAAMTAGHALVSALAGSGPYAHVAQVPALEISLALMVAGVVFAIRRVVSSAQRQTAAADWALPAFSAIQSIGPARVAGLVLSIQFAALIAGESIEQRVSGVALSGVAGLLGSTLSLAPLVHLAIGAAAALALWFVSCEVCRHAPLAIGLVRAVFAWLARARDSVAHVHYRFVPRVCGPQSRPVAFNLANRPPPSFV